MSQETFDPIFPHPTDQQMHALSLTSIYLQRAASQAATRIMGNNVAATPRVVVLNDLSEGMMRSAALCQMLVDLFDGWPVEDR